MNKSTLRNLGIVLFALIAIMIGVEMGGRTDSAATGGAWLPDLKSRINDVASITIERSGSEAVTVSRDSGTWTVASRDDYAASVSKVREVLLAFADASILEQKTADPDRYQQLGVRDPEIEGSAGVRVTVAGSDFSYQLIVGNANQGTNRYARVVGDAQSVLIDSNPSLPDDASGWLRTDLLDIEGQDVEMVTVRHADGEEISIYKTGRDQTDFDVQDLPDGRELSYPTVANSIGSALSDLTLEDVRRADDTTSTSVAAYETFDGLRVTVTAYAADDETWVSIDASSLAADTDEVEGADANQEDAGDAAAEPVDPATTAANINERLRGWQFRIPSFKANQLTRRWDDILKAVEETD